MPRGQKLRNLISFIVLIVLFVALIGVIASDWSNARRVLHQARWRLLIPALGFTFLSLLCSSFIFSQNLRTFGVALNRARLMLIAFVTISVHNLVTLGGVGYVVGGVLLKAQGKDPGPDSSGGKGDPTRLPDIAAASAFNIYLYFALGTTFLPLSLLYIVLSHRLHGRAAAGIGLLVLLACLFAVAVNLAVFLRRFRKSMLRAIGSAIRFISRRSVARRLASFDTSFTHGLSLIRARRGRLAALLAAIIGDWTCCLTTIWFCFNALGVSLPLDVMMSGFFIAIAAGAASMVPGGMGIQDSSMAGVYALLGIPFGRAILAAVLFRIVYYITPFTIGLILYTRLIRTRSSSSSSAASDPSPAHRSGRG